MVVVMVDTSSLSQAIDHIAVVCGEVKRLWRNSATFDAEQPNRAGYLWLV
jgi:hypothetical protein